MATETIYPLHRPSIQQCVDCKHYDREWVYDNISWGACHDLPFWTMPEHEWLWDVSAKIVDCTLFEEADNAKPT